MTPGGFRTRPRVMAVRAAYSMLRSATYGVRHPDVIAEWIGNAYAYAWNWAEQRDYARLCPHPPGARRASWMNPGWLTCELCDRCIHNTNGWLVPIPEQPNACTCTRMPHHEPGEHYAECPQLWMLADGLERPEPLPAALPKPPTATVQYVPPENESRVEAEARVRAMRKLREAHGG